MKYTKQGDPRSGKLRRLSTRLIFFVLASVALLALVSTSAFMAPPPFTGSIDTTDVNCDAVNANVTYANKEAVYVDGGPDNHNDGLPEGNYYVFVTEPDGTLLGSSLGGPLGDTPFHVDSAGNVSGCYQLWAIVSPAPGGGPGYADTTNNGSEYKAWVCDNDSMTNSGCKTDNFKVRKADPPPPQNGALQILKFYDADQDGEKDPGEPDLTGWKVDVSPVLGSNPVLTPFNSIASPGLYTATERDTIETNWFASTPKTLVGSVVLNDTTTIEFGNYCELTPGGHTKGFWSNPNGQKLEDATDFANLTDLHLVNLDGSSRDFTSTLVINKKNLNTWILGANASNMANQLSAQLAATKLSVNHGFTDASVVVFEGGDVNDLIAYADSLLQADNLTLGGDLNRAEQERIKNILDKINNGGSFVQPTPVRCPYTFLP